jgi:drug/metabolite transporter (DMT)-like permease
MSWTYISGVQRRKVTFQVLFGLVLCTAITYLMLYTNLISTWEGQELDGSSSITWRSIVVLLLLIVVTQWISFWTFRRRIALQVFSGTVCCIVITALLVHSSYAFDWESKTSDGFFSLTWRSDIVILLLLSVTQGLSFLAFRWIRRIGWIDRKPL